MSQCLTFDLAKRNGVINTMRCRCEREAVCDGSSCIHVSGIEPVIADDPQDAIQNAALMEISGQATLAAIAAIASK